MEFTINGEPRPDEPSEIIDGCIEARRLLLTGFKGNIKVDKKKWQEAINPTNAAISLAGEPTLYPKISDLIKEFHRRRIKTFLVTNGTRPDRLESLEEKPFQLYVSLCAPDKENYLKVHNPLIKDGWEKINQTLELLPSLGCRTVIRLTLVKGLNMIEPEKYAKLIEKTNCDFVECKSYMHVGESQKRLPREAMATNEEINIFASKLAELIGYHFIDNEPSSRVTLLSRKSLKI